MGVPRCAQNYTPRWQGLYEIDRRTWLGVVDGCADALGTVTAGDRTGTLTVTVGLSDQPAGPCFAGVVDERSTQADGTVLDIQDSKDTSRVIARATDGTRIDVNARGVLTREQVIDIARAPGLRASAPA